MSYEILDHVINGLDNGFIDKKYFEEENLFINIFYCFYFIKYLSPYYSWGDKLIASLKRNIRGKWVKSLPNIEFFIKQMEKRTSSI